jgi:hypothetical protein
MSETDIQNTESTATPVETDVVDTNVETESKDKLFTQQDLDKIVADRVSRERRKYEKKYESVDVDTYHDMLTKAEKEKEDQLKAKGDFEQILKAQAEKKDAQINQLMQTVETIRVDGSLVDEASKAGSINPQQVAKLLKEQVRLADAGEVEILDSKTGQVRYKDDGTHMGISDLVQEFITANKHFLSATPSGMGTTSKVGDVGKAGEQLDISALDMQNPEHRKMYAEYRKKTGISK